MATVLIVDDESIVLEVLSRQLAGWGLQACTAGSAEAALALLGLQKVDAVLLDNVLPGRSGFQILPEIRRLSAAPVVLMSGHFDPEFVKDARLLGAMDVLAKPLDTALLKAALQKALSRPGV